MNRSLRRLALLGLLTLGASGAGAQSTNLFTVTYNPSELKLVVSPTANSATGSLSGKTFLAEYGVFFTSFFASNPSSALLSGNGVPTTNVSGGIAAASNLSATMNEVYSDFVNPRDLIISRSDSANMTFAPTGAAFVSSNGGPLTITFSSNVGSYMRTQSFTGGISVFDNGAYGTEYSIGTYTYSVVPEPSTYAAIAGALGLGYAVYRRRRQAAAAATA